MYFTQKTFITTAIVAKILNEILIFKFNGRVKLREITHLHSLLKIFKIYFFKYIK